jgi:uncharacterized protein (DUF1800 family)
MRSSKTTKARNSLRSSKSDNTKGVGDERRRKGEKESSVTHKKISHKKTFVQERTEVLEEVATYLSKNKEPQQGFLFKSILDHVQAKLGDLVHNAAKLIEEALLILKNHHIIQRVNRALVKIQEPFKDCAYEDWRREYLKVPRADESFGEGHGGGDLVAA